MGYYADIYVIKKTRSKKEVLQFLDYFLPLREESTDEYLIPQYSNSPIVEFNNANDLMNYLELNTNVSNSIYWRNVDKKSLYQHGMVFYTSDSHIIFGISIDTFEVNARQNEQNCLNEIKKLLKSNIGYITHECPPEDSYLEFIEKVKELEGLIHN